MITLLFILIAYFLSATPFGFLIAKWIRQIDIREHGSRNIGATNVFRVVGKKWGILVFILDALKGFVGVCLPRWVGYDYTIPLQITFAVACLAGHTFPVWLRFKGGKGVATSLGVFLAICPIPTLITFGVFCLIFSISHILSLGSLSAALSFPLIITLVSHNHPDFIWLLAIGLFIPVFIFYTHRKNLVRLLRGEEKKLF
ncbi:MAG: glycerol-3-phosphate 1-O-acyltransferase [Candidatus Omnitrophica bacterium]|nr:glycerol-3-phosphate 1-O-acyltransferase [Candidatus Omnitrophota bacterium]